MKQSQLIFSLVSLTGIVFLVTFLLNFVGDGPGAPRAKTSKTTDVPGELTSLTFASTKYPPTDDQFPVSQEVGTNGFQDYWFANETASPIELMLDDTSCKCTEVRVFLAPADYQNRWLTRKILQRFMVSQTVPALSTLGLIVASDHDAGLAAIKEMVEKDKGTLLVKRSGKGCPIPPGGSGWVRLHWKANAQEVPGLAFRTATLSTQDRAAPQIFLAAAIFLEAPFRVLEQNEQLGELDPKQLPKEMDILVWSAVRSELDLDVQQAVVRGSTSSDPIKIGNPVPATSAEIAKIEKTMLDKKDPRVVRCAYRVPVIVRDHEEGNNKLMDLGAFRRQIFIRLKKEDGVEPVVVTLEGSVQGEVILEGKGRISLPIFFSRDGSRKGICNLSSSLENLKVEIDRERTSKFLTVTLAKEPEKIGNRYFWPIEVSVDANKVLGRFPRDDDPDYRDSAIYLKCTGSSTRNIRIAVDGNAKER